MHLMDEHFLFNDQIKQRIDLFLVYLKCVRDGRAKEKNEGEGDHCEDQTSKRKYSDHVLSFSLFISMNIDTKREKRNGLHFDKVDRPARSQ